MYEQLQTIATCSRSVALQSLASRGEALLFFLTSWVRGTTNAWRSRQSQHDKELERSSDLCSFKPASVVTVAAHAGRKVSPRYLTAMSCAGDRDYETEAKPLQTGHRITTSPPSTSTVAVPPRLKAPETRNSATRSCRCRGARCFSRQ